MKLWWIKLSGDNFNNLNLNLIQGGELLMLVLLLLQWCQYHQHSKLLNSVHSNLQTSIKLSLAPSLYENPNLYDFGVPQIKWEYNSQLHLQNLHLKLNKRSKCLIWTVANVPDIKQSKQLIFLFLTHVNYDFFSYMFSLKNTNFSVILLFNVLDHQQLLV